MENPELILKALTHLSKHSLQFAMDDFGTGYSSLSYLKKMPVDYLKIDRSFVSDIGTSLDSEAIIKSMLQLGRVLNLAVIAEGVETKEELAFLKKHGCELIQGYYFHKPMSPDKISQLLQTKKSS